MSAVLAPAEARLRVATATGGTGRLLDALETQALLRTFGEGFTTSRADEDEAHRVIRRLVAKGEHLDCLCHGDGTAALMRPYTLPGGQGALRSPGGGHATACPFRSSTAPRGHLRILQRAAAPRRPAPGPASGLGLRRPLAPLLGPVAIV